MSEKIEKFIGQLKRKSENTKESRKNALYRLENYVEKEIDQLEEDDIEDFIRYLQDGEDLRHSTINNYLSAIRQYYKYLEKQLTIGVTEDELRQTLQDQKRYNSIIDIDNLPERDTVKRAIPRSGVEDLLRRAKEKNEQLYRIFVLLGYLGVRKGELIHLRGAQVKRGEREIEIENSKTLSGERTIPYSPEIEEFMECDGEYLIESSQGGCYSPPALNNALRRYENDITGHLYPHRLRETLDTYLLEEGVDKFIINKLMGWKGSGDMADYYRGRTEKLKKEKRRVMEEDHYLLPLLKKVKED